jgi:hypothetical protein
MAALVDIRNQVIRLGQEVAALRAEPPQGSDAMNSVTAELREAVRFLAERLDGVARMVAQRGEELADTRGALGAIDAHVRSQAETIGVLTTGMQALPTYGQQVSGVQESINALQQRLGNIEGSLGQRLGGIEQAVARPADASIAERLSALEGMLGPLAQRLAQAHNDHAASLQALHGKVESIAAGTQAALAQPATLDESAMAALEPKLAGLASDIQSLRSDVAAVVAARGSSDAPGAPVDLAPLAMQITQLSGEVQSLRSDVAAVVAARAGAEGSDAAAIAPVDLSPISAKLSELSEQLTVIASAPRAETASAGAGADVDVDGAIGAAEQRIMAHVDDAIVALAQTLLGRAGTVAPVDTPAPAEEAPAKAVPAVAPPAPVSVAVRHDEDDYDDEPDDEDDLDEDHLDEDHADVAQIDFSQVDLDDEDDEDEDDEAEDEREPRSASPSPRWAPKDPDPGSPFGPQSSPPVPGVDSPFDQEAVWGPPPLPVPPEGPSTVVPERRRRWFSW